MSLKTGVPIVSMALTERQSYADVDGDGVVDSILVFESVRDLFSTSGNTALARTFSEDRDKLKHCMVSPLSYSNLQLD